MIFYKEKKNSLVNEKKESLVQEWLPVIDIQKNFIITNETIVGVLRVWPINIHLKSLSETKRILQGLTGAYNSFQDSVQIICLDRPVDLDNYIRYVENLSKEQNNLLKRKLLNQYLNYVQELIASGEAIEKRFYILMSEKKGKYAVKDLQKRLEMLEESLVDVGLNIKRCNDRDLIDLLFTFSNPGVSAFEKEPDNLNNNIFYNITF